MNMNICIYSDTHVHTHKSARERVCLTNRSYARGCLGVHKHACTCTKTAKGLNSGYLRPLLNYWKKENLEEKGRLSEAYYVLDVKRNPMALPLYQNLAENNYEESWGYPELLLMISLTGYYILNIFYVSGTLCNYARAKLHLTVNPHGEGNPHSSFTDQNTQTEGHPHQVRLTPSPTCLFMGLASLWLRLESL